jgi:hypothetical protein
MPREGKETNIFLARLSCTLYTACAFISSATRLDLLPLVYHSSFQAPYKLQATGTGASAPPIERDGHDGQAHSGHLNAEAHGRLSRPEAQLHCAHLSVSRPG